ncbi:MAG: hypothetical protein EOO41_03990, partial [Methanobacteriota archaeon]
MLKELGHPDAHNAGFLSRLVAQMDKDRIGMIVWSEFWTAIAPWYRHGTPIGQAAPPQPAAAPVAAGAGASGAPPAPAGDVSGLLEMLRTVFN